MAYTVAVAFDQFFEKINLSGDHRAKANTRKDHIVDLLKNDFQVLDAFATGSIPRFTAVKSASDVDIIVALHYGKHIKDKKPSVVLKAVRDALSEYKTDVRRSGQAVTLYYETWPNVDIVPAAQVADSQGNVTEYSIPDMNTELWLSSRLKQHSDNIEARSSAVGPNFRKIIKMVKWWNIGHSGLLQSFHIEVMALNALTATLNDMPWDVYKCFDSAATLAASSLSYEGSAVDAYLDYASRQAVVSRLQKARDIALDAWHSTFGSNNDHKGAIERWKVLFGDEFPSYG